MAEMPNENEGLARRAVKCKGWRWMPGMAVLKLGPSGVVVGTVVGVGFGDVLYVCAGHLDGWTVERWRVGGCEPSMVSPATLGCLLALVREAWGAEVLLLAEVVRQGACAGQVSHRVAIFRPENSVDWGRTERYIFETSPVRPFRPVSVGAALVAALEAAP